MILAIDPGWKCGWAVVEPKTTRLIALGVFTSDPDKAIAKSTDRARRVAALGAELASVRDAHVCTAIAAESMLCYGAPNAVIPQVLVWGMLTRLAAEIGVGLVEVIAKDWQHAVTPGVKKIDYDKVKRALAVLAGRRLELIPKDLRTHALDAVGIGAFAALRSPKRITSSAVGR